MQCRSLYVDKTVNVQHVQKRGWRILDGEDAAIFIIKLLSTWLGREHFSKIVKYLEAGDHFSTITTLGRTVVVPAQNRRRGRRTLCETQAPEEKMMDIFIDSTMSGST